MDHSHHQRRSQNAPTVRLGRRAGPLLALVSLLLALVVPSPVSAAIVVRVENKQVNGTYRPVVGDFTDGRSDSIVWYGRGSLPDSMWTPQEGSFLSPINRSLSIGGDYRPIAGQFWGSDRDDIYLWGPGSAPDRLLVSNGDGTFTNIDPGIDIGGTDKPIVGRFIDRFPHSTDQLLQYGPGLRNDTFYDFSGTAARAEPIVVNGTYRPVVASVDGSLSEGIIWYAPGSAADFIWKFSDCGQGYGHLCSTSRAVTINGTYTPVEVSTRYVDSSGTIGSCSGGILWYRPGADNDHLWPGCRNRISGDIGSRMDPAYQVTGTYEPVEGSWLSGGVVVWRSATGTDQYWFWSGGASGYLKKPYPSVADQQPLVGRFAGGFGGDSTVFWYGPGTKRDVQIVVHYASD